MRRRIRKRERISLPRPNWSSERSWTGMRLQREGGQTGGLSGTDRETASSHEGRRGRRCVFSSGEGYGGTSCPS